MRDAETKHVNEKEKKNLLSVCACYVCVCVCVSVCVCVVGGGGGRKRDDIIEGFQSLSSFNCLYIYSYFKVINPSTKNLLI